MSDRAPSPLRVYDYESVADRLGKVADRVLAKELGCSPSLILFQRRRRKIAKYDPLRAYESILGTRPDRLIAEAAGVSKRSVKRRREKLGIISYYERRRIFRSR